MLFGLHVAHLRTRRLLLVPGGVIFSAGLLWGREVFQACPDPQLAAAPGGGFELRGQGGVRIALEGIDAGDAGAIREALARESQSA